MAVSATELRPRNAVAIFDAAVRLVTTTSGLWAFTLPSGAALIAAGFSLADAIRAQRPLWLPCALWCLAWVFRALSQGAACHYAEHQVLGVGEPNTWVSWLAALKRAPSLITTSAFLLVISLVMLAFTMGLGFAFFGAHAVGYAVAMRGQGHPLNLLSTSSTLLGPTRFTAVLVRVCGAIQLVFALNFHLAVSLLLSLGTQLFGLDLTFASHFVSVTNPLWLVVIALTTFSCFEPIRAATSALLLIDGRVRQEGLDLVAAAQQLPSRKKKAASFITAALLVLVAGQAFGAQKTALRGRVEKVARACRFSSMVDQQALDDLDALDEKERGAATRFVGRVESRAYDSEDCEGAESELGAGLKQIRATRALELEVDSAASREEARAILSRPEFQTDPDKPAEPDTEPEPEGESTLARWWRHFLEWLVRVFTSRPQSDGPSKWPDAPQGSMAGAEAVIVLVLVLVIAIGVYAAVGYFRKKAGPGDVPETSPLETPLSDDPMSALSRPAQTWASQADELAARGEFREAIRHLYLALLARLHAEGRISYDSTRSNWEYLRELKGTAALLASFRELTRRFDFAWYGHLMVDPLAYGTFRDLTAPLLAAEQSDLETPRRA